MDELIQLIISLPLLSLSNTQENELGSLISSIPPAERIRSTIKYFLKNDPTNFSDARLINSILDYLAIWEATAAAALTLEYRLANAWENYTKKKAALDDLLPLGTLYIQLPDAHALLKQIMLSACKIDALTSEGQVMLYLYTLILDKIKIQAEIKNKKNAASKEEHIISDRIATTSHPLHDSIDTNPLFDENDNAVLAELDHLNKNALKTITIQLRKEDRELKTIKENNARQEIDELMRVCSTHILTLDHLIREKIALEQSNIIKKSLKTAVNAPSKLISLFSSVTHSNSNASNNVFNFYLNVFSSQFTLHPKKIIADLQNELVTTHRILLIITQKGNCLTLINHVTAHLQFLLKEKNAPPMNPNKLPLIVKLPINIVKSIGQQTLHVLNYVNPLQLLPFRSNPPFPLVINRSSAVDLFMILHPIAKQPVSQARLG